VAAAADADALAGRGVKIAPTMAGLRALKPTLGSSDQVRGDPRAGDLAWLRGHHRPNDGGEGFFHWDAESKDTDNGGTVIALDGGRGRWVRQFTPGTITASWFQDLSSLIAYCKANTPITVHLPRGEWDFSGIGIPTGITFIGIGLIWQGGAAHGGFKNGSVILGNPAQETGPSANRFVGVVFDGGFTVRKQYTYFDNCAFTGGSLIFDQRDASPYYCTVENSLFRGIPDGPCIRFIAQANANRIVNSTILVSQNQRGIVAEGHKGGYPTTNVIIGCGIERHGGVTQIGSYVYGDFHSLTFLGNYLDATRPKFTDGAEIVFTPNSRRNRVWLPNQYGNTYVNQGAGHTFYGATEGSLYVGSRDFDLASLSSLPEMLITDGGAKDIMLPPIQNSYGKTVTLSCERHEGTTVHAARKETINGSPSMALKHGDGFLLYTKHYPGSAPTNWIARKIW
jgi:hypothetical protein